MKRKYRQIQRLLTFLLCLGLVFPAMAQQTVSGTVKDETGLGLPGVTIQVKGTTQGTTTDIDGKYTVKVPSAESVLVFSYIGYKTQEITVGVQSAINIQMEVEETTLEELVVVGYGEVKKEDATGSITAIGTEKFNKGVIASPQDLLTGRVAGVQITSSGGVPGSGSTIRIRGGSSLSASNNPLFVIDGVVVSDEGVSGVSNPLSTINPNDIETITVLKDASATAIYGSRASNGVVLVTTKRGEGDKIRFNYTGNVGISVLPTTVDVLSSSQYDSLIRNNAGSTTLPSDAVNLLGTNSTDWQDEIYQQAFTTDNNISANGTFKNVPFRASVGYFNQEGVLKTSKYNRLSAALAVDPSFFNDALQVKIDAKYSLAKSSFADQGAIGSAVGFDPTQAVNQDGSPWGGYYYWPQAGDPSLPNTIAPANPLALLNLKSNEADVNRFIGSVQFDYAIPFVDGLKAHLNVATDRSKTDGLETAPGTLTTEINSQGFTNRYEGKYENNLFESYFLYKKDLESISSVIDVTAGYSWQRFFRETPSFRDVVNPGLDDNDFDGDPSENFLVSFYGRLNYSFKNKYLLTATLRRDGSSRFAEDERWGVFPAVAFAWKVKEESFLKNVKAISNLKLRVGYGVTGQENVNGSAYPSIALAVASELGAQYQFGTDTINTIRPNGFNAKLKWEETTTYNAGVDLGLFGDRVTATFDYYFRETTDLLNVINAPAGTNLTNRIISNIGSLENEGFEIGLDFILIEKDNMSLDAGVNITRNRNKITKLIAGNDPSFIGVATGGIAGGTGNTIQIHTVGSPANSFFVYEQVYDESGRPVEGLYVDQDGNGVINNNDRVRYENPVPDTYFGFYSRFNYKNFDLSFNARMNLGNYAYNNVNSNGAHFNALYNSSGFLTNTTPDIYNTMFNEAQLLSSYYLQDASFFRMDNITAGYRLPKLANDKLDVYVNFTIQNAFVITDYEGLDPEVDGGIDNNFYPRPRTFLLGVNVNF